MFVNWARDTFLLSRRFPQIDIEVVMSSRWSSAEERRLALFANLFSHADLVKIQRVHLVATLLKDQNYPSWYQRSLNFSEGLKHIRILTTAFGMRIRLEMQLEVNLGRLGKGVGGEVPDMAFEMSEKDLNCFEAMMEEMMREHDIERAGTTMGKEIFAMALHGYGEMGFEKATRYRY